MVQLGPQWFHGILKWSQTVPESPRQSSKFQKIPKFYHFQDGNRLFISTARWSRSSSVSKFYDNLPLILKIPSRHLSVLNGPSGSSMVPLDPKMVPDSPRESQTTNQVSEKFPSFTIFRNRLFISTVRWSRSSSVSKSYDNLLLIPKIPSRHLSVPNGPSGPPMVPLDPQMVPDSPRESQTIIQVSEKIPNFYHFQKSTIY